MADRRPLWRGHLRLALVSCPVALYTARHAASELHFHFINPKTNNRIRMLSLDAGTGEEVKRSDLVKGYEFEKDSYVILNDEDFERAKIDSSTTLNVDKFVPADAIDPVYYDASYYMAPDGDAGEDVYLVLRDAIAQSGRVALSRVVIARRERAVAVMPMGNGLILHTLHDHKDMVDPEELFADLPDAKPDPAMVKLATQLIDRQTGAFVPADMEDRYEARLREVIEAKLRGEAGAAPTDEEPDRSNVIDLMAALKRSLGLGKRSTAKKVAAKPDKPAKAGAGKPRKTAPAKQGKARKTAQG